MLYLSRCMNAVIWRITSLPFFLGSEVTGIVCSSTTATPSPTRWLSSWQAGTSRPTSQTFHLKSSPRECATQSVSCTWLQPDSLFQHAAMQSSVELHKFQIKWATMITGSSPQRGVFTAQWSSGWSVFRRHMPSHKADTSTSANSV